MLSTNGKCSINSSTAPFALRRSKSERRFFNSLLQSHIFDERLEFRFEFS
jgi:hypothetical protein